MVRTITAEQAKKEREAKRAEERKPPTHWGGVKISDKMVRCKILENFVMHDGKECVRDSIDSIAENYIPGLVVAKYVSVIKETAANKAQKETR